MKKTAIIDADSLLYYEMGHDSIDDATAYLVERIRNICENTGATHYVLYLTPEHTFRHDLAFTKPYKGNRRDESEKPPMFFALKHYAIHTLGAVMIEGLEADDMVGLHMAKIMASGKEDAVLAAIDKDVLGQISGRHWNYQKAEWVNTSEEDAAKFLWVQCIAGDSTDNIQGIPRAGAAKAEKILDSDYPAETLNAYIEKFGPTQGVATFTEMFLLVAILQDEEVAKRYAKVEYANPIKVTELPVVVAKVSGAEAGFEDLTVDEVESTPVITDEELDDL